jgi:tRNA (guanine37-N1)-methyltransferase
MKITVITLFPKLIEEILSTSIIGRASKKGLVEYQIVDLRQFGEGIHQVVDGRPYSGGPGMLLRADILTKALKSVYPKKSKNISVILTSAAGKTFNQQKAKKLLNFKELIIVCGHYEGVDQRFVDKYVDEEISIGDFVLTGGELPAMMVADAVIRLIPGVLKKDEATLNESFSENLLEYPQYTRPENFEGLKVPEILLSGNHQKIADWQKEKSKEITKKVRPDLLKK